MRCEEVSRISLTHLACPHPQQYTGKGEDTLHVPEPNALFNGSCALCPSFGLSHLQECCSAGASQTKDMSWSIRGSHTDLPYYPPFTEETAQLCRQAGSREDGERNLSPLFTETSGSQQDGSLLGFCGTFWWSSGYTAPCFSVQPSLCTFPVIMLWTTVGSHPPVPCATQPQERSYAATRVLAVQQGGLRTGGSRWSVDIAR